jgi:hypothetical protein
MKPFTAYLVLNNGKPYTYASTRGYCLMNKKESKFAQKNLFPSETIVKVEIREVKK